MKCQNFECDNHKGQYWRKAAKCWSCSNYHNVSRCESRKRYNRTIAPILRIVNSAGWGILTKLERNELSKAVKKLSDERKKYHGREGL